MDYFGWFVVIGLFCYGVVFADELDISLEISQDVIFKRHGPILLECRYSPESAKHEVMFAWRHNDSKLVLGEPNAIDTLNYVYVYRYSKEDAISEDAGTYDCKIEGKAGAISTTVTEIQVDERPIIGELDSRVNLKLLATPQNNVLCYTGTGVIQEVENCEDDFVLTEDAVGNHSFVLVSASAKRHYKTIEKSIEKEVTVSLTKQYIGLSIDQSMNNVALELYGDKTILKEMTISCIKGPAQTVIDVEEMEPGARDKYAFSCERNITRSEITIEILWNNQVLYTKTVGKASSSRDHMNGTLLSVCLPLCLMLYTSYS